MEFDETTESDEVSVSFNTMDSNNSYGMYSENNRRFTVNCLLDLEAVAANFDNNSHQVSSEGKFLLNLPKLLK
jgi:hypothetical protein